MSVDETSRPSRDVASVQFQPGAPVASLDDRPHAVYRLYDADDALLYVGCTVDVGSRVYALATGKRWMPQAVRLTVQHFPNRPAALTAEATAIDAEMPRCNGTHL